MKPHFTIFIYLLIYSINTNTSLGSEIPFSKHNFETTQQLAQEYKQHILVYFFAEWCTSCQVMEETTFQDDQLAHFVAYNFIAVKADVDQPYGKIWKDQFGVTSLPTFIVLNNEGQIIAREESPFVSNGLRNFLNQSIQSEPAQAVAVNVSNKSTSNNHYKETSIKNSSSKQSNVSTSVEKKWTNFAPAKRVITQVINRNPSNLASDRTYKIQAGVFKNYENALKLIQRLKDRFPEHEVNLFSDQKDHKKKYTIYLGTFYGLTSARDFAREMQNSGYKGLVRDKRYN